MSVNPRTGRHECDACGHDVGGGGLASCAIVSDLDPDRPGIPRTLEYCRDRPAEQPEDADPDAPVEVVKGCARKLVTPTMIAHYKQMQESSGGST